jgi:hypothetical protein
MLQNVKAEGFLFTGDSQPYNLIHNFKQFLVSRDDGDRRHVVDPLSFIPSAGLFPQGMVARIYTFSWPECKF